LPPSVTWGTDDLRCNEDGGIFGGITQSYANTFIGLYWMLAVEAVISMCASLVLASLFHHFSRLPMSAFRGGRKDLLHRIMLRLGVFCKHGLWAMNLLSFYRLLLFVIFLIVMVTDPSYQRDMSQTIGCPGPTCPYGKYINCRIALPDDPLSCLDEKKRATFSGIRGEGLEAYLNITEAPLTEAANTAGNEETEGNTAGNEADTAGNEANTTGNEANTTGNETNTAGNETNTPQNDEEAIFIYTPRNDGTSDESSSVLSESGNFTQNKSCSTLPAHYQITGECADLDHTTIYSMNLIIVITETTCLFTLVTIGMMIEQFARPETIFYHPSNSPDTPFWTFVSALGPG